MFRRPKVPDDKNKKKQLIFTFVSFFIFVFIDSHM